MLSTQKTETPIAFVKAVEDYFNIKFEYDLAASKENAKCPHYFTYAQNSLRLPWPKNCYCWLNPPFANLTIWINKCMREAETDSRIFSIWPLSGDLNQIPVWKNTHVYVIHGRIWSLVRSVMLCEWGGNAHYLPDVSGLIYKDEQLTLAWGSK
jgi:phage N-6-adenine-methyltransferase